MSCKCRDNKIVYSVKPDQYCLECIRKHISLAMVLYFQPGYTLKNAMHVQGNLSAAELHCMNTNTELCEKIRALRKKVMYKEKIDETDFISLREFIDSL